MPTNPEDKELRKFVVEFAGWTKLNWHEAYREWYGARPDNPTGPAHYCSPAFTRSVDAWLLAIWPKIVEKGEDFIDRWALCLEEICNEVYTDGAPRADWGRIANASAQQRCQALWNALIVSPVVYDKQPETFGDIMTVAEFREFVKEGGVTDYDGGGCPMKDGLMATLMITPSTIDKIPPDATHIQWYNR